MIGVESIRDVIRQTDYTAMQHDDGLVLDPADILRDEAANALLKPWRNPQQEPALFWLPPRPAHSCLLCFPAPRGCGSPLLGGPPPAAK